jgi:hypothetical protein
MAESFKEKDEEFVKETVDLLVKLSNMKDEEAIFTPFKPGEYISEDRRVTVTLTKSNIKETTGRTVVREDALKNLATQFEQYGCTALITKDELNVTSPVEPSKKFSLDELRRSVNEGMDEEE